MSLHLHLHMHRTRLHARLALLLTSCKARGGQEEQKEEAEGERRVQVEEKKEGERLVTYLYVPSPNPLRTSSRISPAGVLDTAVVTRWEVEVKERGETNRRKKMRRKAYPPRRRKSLGVLSMWTCSLRAWCGSRQLETCCKMGYIEKIDEGDGGKEERVERMRNAQALWDRSIPSHVAPKQTLESNPETHQRHSEHQEREAASEDSLDSADKSVWLDLPAHWHRDYNAHLRLRGKTSGFALDDPQYRVFPFMNKSGCCKACKDPREVPAIN
ncbi:hypothetical protein C8J57DRAFT_1469264 [Mycena rebaudengoi]|nr:hypothetical protein C8J57DRAFT_1469264 [Mycena rebaudengoi]